MIVNIIAGAIVLIIIGNAVFHIYRAKKNGQACIGCPDSKNCGKCSCSGKSDS